MPSLETWTLWVHIAAGIVAIGAGGVALLATKGARRHRRAGRLFVGAMAVVVGTVFPLLVLDPTTLRWFLALVAVFSGYLAFSGYRIIARRRAGRDPGTIDRAASAAVVIACAVLGGWGTLRLLDGGTFGIVMVVFGVIGLVMGLVDLRAFRRRTAGNDWLVRHLQRMVAAVIATVSAVSAVNLTPTLGVLAWLWPTILGTPLIAYWSNRYGW